MMRHVGVGVLVRVGEGLGVGVRVAEGAVATAGVGTLGAPKSPGPLALVRPHLLRSG